MTTPGVFLGVFLVGMLAGAWVILSLLSLVWPPAGSDPRALWSLQARARRNRGWR